MEHTLSEKLARLASVRHAADLERTEELRPQAIRLARTIVGDCDTAEDVAQEAIVRLIHSDPPPTHTGAWMKTVVVRLAQRALEHRAISCEYEQAASYDPTLDIAVQQTLARLSPESRTILALALSERWSYKEISAACDIPMGTVASRIHNAKQEFRDKWRDA